MPQNFAAILKQAKLATKGDIDDFGEKLKPINRRDTSSKIRHVESETKLNDVSWRS